MLFVLGLQAAHVLTDTGRLYYPLSLTQKAELHLDKDTYLFSVFDPEKKPSGFFSLEWKRRLQLTRVT